MSSMFLPEGDPFLAHHAAGSFLEAAKFAFVNYGNPHIPYDTLIDLQQKNVLEDREVPALAYLAQNRVRKTGESL